MESGSLYITHVATWDWRCLLSDQATMFPLEFFVEGAPKSSGASSLTRELWKAKVRDTARGRVRETVDWSLLDGRRIAVTIYYFSLSAMEGDVDNIIKPILDAMIAVAYPDDRVVERLLVQKFEPDMQWSFGETSETLANALRTEAPVVYIRVDDDLSWRVL